MSTFKLRVISAEGRFFDGECESLVFPTLDGMTGILVLSGEATMDDVAVSTVKPDLIFGRLSDMIEYL